MKKLIENFTILIPTFNRETILEKNLSKLLNQNFICKIIVLDNNSTDKTYEILKKYSSRKNLEVYKNNKNEGFVFSFIKLLELAKTDYVVYLSDEDSILLENLFVISKRIDSSISVSMSSIYKSDGQPYQIFEYNRVIKKKEALKKYSFKHHYISGICFRIRDINLNVLWNEYHSKEKGKLDVYPHIYLINQLFHIGNLLLNKELLIVQQLPSKSHMDKINRNHYSHTSRRIAQFEKNLVQIEKFSIGKLAKLYVRLRLIRGLENRLKGNFNLRNILKKSNINLLNVYFLILSSFSLKLFIKTYKAFKMK